MYSKRYVFNSLPDNKILERSNLKQSADDNFEFDENSRKFTKRVENTVGKGEIARHEQFLLFPQCFEKACFLEASKGVIVWEWVKLETYNSKYIILFINSLLVDKFIHFISMIAFVDNKLSVAQKKNSVFEAVGNIVGKRENAGYQPFLLLSQCSPIPSSLKSFIFGIVKG